jgi:polyferredoxin
MAEENKAVKQEDKAEAKKNIAATALKVLIGLTLLVLGGLALFSWWPELMVIFKGSIGLFLILAGIITLAIAKE